MQEIKKEAATACVVLWKNVCHFDPSSISIQPSPKHFVT